MHGAMFLIATSAHYNRICKKGSFYREVAAVILNTFKTLLSILLGETMKEQQDSTPVPIYGML